MHLTTVIGSGGAACFPLVDNIKSIDRGCSDCRSHVNSIYKFCWKTWSHAVFHTHSTGFSALRPHSVLRYFRSAAFAKRKRSIWSVCDNPTFLSPLSAECNGVAPKSDYAFISAPLPNRSCAIPTLQLSAAICIAVIPFACGVLMSAILSRINAVIASFWCVTQWCSINLPL